MLVEPKTLGRESLYKTLYSRVENTVQKDLDFVK